MSLKENALEATVVAGIAFLSALVAIAATHGHFPEWFDGYTSLLAAGLAFLVRFASRQGYEPEKE